MDDASTGRTVRLMGGPLDGTVWADMPPADACGDGTWVVVDGWGDQRAAYEPLDADDPDTWWYCGLVQI